jgi:Fe-S-cluster containining protein
MRRVPPSTAGNGVASGDPVALLHAEVAAATQRLHLLHAARLQCRQGCSSCCVDGLTVFEPEAQRIRSRHAGLLATGKAHAEGACAFLDEHGGCRIYADRPYVCRTQGLPLRWIEERDGGVVELRDICPLNEAGEPVEELNAEACWSIGPFEERLARLALEGGAGSRRTRLRDLFGVPLNGHPTEGGPSSSKFEPQVAIPMGDKSPKAKDKSKKQHAADKNQKHVAAVEKAKPAPTGAGKKGK